MSVEYRPVEDEPKSLKEPELTPEQWKGCAQTTTELAYGKDLDLAKVTRQRNHWVGISIVLLLLFLSACGALLQKACGG